MSRPWLDANQRARAVALADALTERAWGGGFSPAPLAASGDAAFRAVRSLAVAEISDPEAVGRFILRGGEAPQVAAPDPEAERIAEREAMRAEIELHAMEQARAAYEAELGAAVGAARDLIAALGEARSIDADALGQGLNELVMSLVGQVIEAQVTVDPSFVADRVGRAMGLLKDRLEPGRLHLNPADVALVEGRYPNLTLVADAGLPRGALRLSAEGGEIVDSTEARLMRLREALDRF